MHLRNDAPTVFPLWLHRRALLSGIGALLSGALLAACGESTGAQETASPPLPPAASGGSTGAQGTASPSPTSNSVTVTTYPNGVTVSTSIGVPSNGPLSSLASATAPPAASRVAGAPPMITNGDNGTTVNLAAGAQVVLGLDNDHDWAVTVADEAVLTPVVGAAVPSGAQGVYTASKAGQTTLTAVGEPLCRKVQPPCGAPTVLFRAQVAVV